MAIQISPSVLVQERDLTNVIPAVSSSIGAAVINAAWGPVLDVTAVDSENLLVQLFGRPNTLNAGSWFAAANFLSYSAAALIVRSDATNQYNSVSQLTGRVTSVSVVSGGTAYIPSETLVTFSEPDIDGGIQAEGVAVISGGVIASVSITQPGTGYTSAPIVTVTSTGAGVSANITASITQGGVKVLNAQNYSEIYENGSGVVGPWIAKYPGSLGNSLKISMADSASFATWEYRAIFGIAPGTSDFASENAASNDELHLVVIDRDGKWSGQAGSVLESFAFLSKASNAKRADGTVAYYKNVVNSSSKYIYWADHPENTTNWGLPASGSVAFNSLPSTAPTFNLVGGSDDFTSTEGQLMSAFALFDNDEQYDISLIVTGNVSRTVSRFVLDSVVDARKDCMVFISPRDVDSGEPIMGSMSDAAEKTITFKNGNGSTLASMPSSSYVVYDTGFKYQYDRYNDVYRWVPLNGDVAGLCARTDFTNDPWFSPAGFNRGQIKNVVKLAYSPRKADRDTLYLNGINPVVSFPGQGVILYGDKTGQAKPSAFDRINVRRLFISMEKAIATSAKYQLFEFNDSFSRAQFRNMVEPYLRDVKGRRGITDFKVVCDETNNTGEVIDGNRFVADIYIKPNRSINFVTLNFIATRTSASFTEITS